MQILAPRLYPMLVYKNFQSTHADLAQIAACHTQSSPKHQLGLLFTPPPVAYLLCLICDDELSLLELLAAIYKSC